MGVTTLFAAGCHNHNLDSGYGAVFVTLTSEPGDYTGYIVDFNSITLTRSDGAIVTGLSSPTTVDLTKLSNYSELLGTATIPVGTYVSASIELNYTGPSAAGTSVISVMVNGKPVPATVHDSTGAVPTTIIVNVNFDPATANALTLVPTYATTDAVRLALTVNLAASTQSIDYSQATPVVTVKPYITAAIAPADNKMVRIRGPLINSSVDLLSYTVYERPSFDEQYTLGTVTIFTDANTVFATNGVVTTGTPGLTQLSHSSAGTTVTAAFTTYTPTLTPSATAAKFYAKYVIAGSTLEDVYTQGLEGDVIARSGNTLTLQGATLFLNDGLAFYLSTDTPVTVGPSTIVTSDGSPTKAGLDYSSIAVGQHVIVRGEYHCAGSCDTPITGTNTFDATGTTSTNTGSVRLVPTYLWGNFVSATTSGLTLNLQAIDGWPVSDYAFSGNGSTAASDPVAASFLVNTGTLAQPAFAAGDPVFLSGLFAPFGTAPPDFTASAVNSELSVQSVGAATGSVTCGQSLPSLDCFPASLRVNWSGASTAAVFSTLSTTGIMVDVTSATYVSGQIRIGAESIDLATLPAAPLIVPQAGTSAGTGLPALYLPLFTFGDPIALNSSGVLVGLNMFSDFGTFTSGLTTALTTTAPLQLEARGTFNRATNTFSASTVNVVL